MSTGSDLKDVHDVCSTRLFDLVVLCQTVSEEEAAIVMAVVNAFNSGASVLSLNQFASSYIFRPHANAPVSSVGVGSATAKAFLSTVKEVLAIGDSAVE